MFQLQFVSLTDWQQKVGAQKIALMVAIENVFATDLIGVAM